MDKCCSDPGNQEVYSNMVEQLGHLLSESVRWLGIDRLEAVAAGEMDWTEVCLALLAAAHVTTLLFFFCSRSTIMTGVRQ